MSQPPGGKATETPEALGNLEALGNWEAALAYVVSAFDADGTSAAHARLRIPLHGSTSAQPVMVWRGVSTLTPGREAIHLASPIAREEACDLLALAAEVDIIPLGALRVMDGIVHVHETLRLPGVKASALDASIRLLAAEAAEFAKETPSKDSQEGEP